jgi:DNA-binding XRE family transcriptional regulator
MPKRRQSGDPRVIWGAQLAFCRERVGLTQTQLADLIPYSLDSLRSAETGRRAPTPDLAKHCDGALSTGGALLYLYDDLRELTSSSVHPPWFGPWLIVEREVPKLWTFEPLVVPGLLQTAAYARALLRADRPTDTDEQIDAAVMARLSRQTILEGESPTKLVAILDESVLQRAVGGASVMAEQLAYVAEMATRRNITVRLIQFDVGAHPGLAGAFVIALPEKEPTLVYRDSIVEGSVTGNPEIVTTVVGLWESIEADALPQRASTELVRSWAETWKNS